MKLVFKQAKTHIKNLTVKQSYDVITELADDFVLIKNDRGIQAKYSKNLFEPPAPAITVRTPQEVISHTNITVEKENEENIRIRLQSTVPHANNFISVYLSMSGISCGVSEINGMIQMQNVVKGFLHSYEQNALFELQDRNQTEKALAEIIFNKVLELIADSHSVGILLFSNVVADEFNLINNVVTERSDFESEVHENPNSGNNIKVWGVLI